MFYNIGKICIYCLASVRQQTIFNQNLYNSKDLSISRIQSNILRLIFVIIPSLLWFVYLYYFGYNHIEIILIPKNRQNSIDYKYCSITMFNHVVYAQIILALIGVCDIIFRLITLSIFIQKSIAVTIYYKQNMNAKKRDIINKLSKLMRKTNLLDITTSISTLIFLVSSAYISQQFLYFLIIDAIISSCCTIELFKFGDKLYKKTCFKCEPLCVYILFRKGYMELGFQKTLTNSAMEYQTFDDDMVNKNSVHLKYVDSSVDQGNRPGITTSALHSSSHWYKLVLVVEDMI